MFAIDKRAASITFLVFVAFLLVGFFGASQLHEEASCDYANPYPEPNDDLIILGLILFGIFAFALFLAWIAGSIILIVKGGTSSGSRGRSRMNPERILGILLLVSPMAVVLLSAIVTVIVALTQFKILLILIPLFILVILIGLIIYAVKNKLKILSKILIAVMIVFIISLLTTGTFLNYGGDTATSSSVGIGTSSSVGIGTSTSGPQPISPLGGIATSTSGGFTTNSARADSSDRIGLAVGGANDINNFRRNVENDFLPITTDITYEGLFFDYFFDTGEKEVCQKLFCPSYSYAISEDPFSKEEDYYLSVGLNSGIKEADFERKNLNLVVVLDISGSMSSSFDTYYYDAQGVGRRVEEETNKSKLEIATESLVALIDHLNEDDRFALVLFDDDAYLEQPLRRIGDSDVDEIKKDILALTPQGGTNFEAGYNEGTKLFENVLDVNPEEYENRIIFLTDAMPNRGALEEDKLLGLTEKNAESKIYSTFIGIGIDFNTELIEFVTKVKGANYYSVHSAKQFKTRLDDEFDYLVTPLVFDLVMRLDANGYAIEKVYGSPETNKSTGEILRVNTLFPSTREEGQTKGGIILLKLKKTSDDASLRLSVSYEDRDGRLDGDATTVVIEESANYYENSGIRKAILLSRYADLVKNWINDERESYKEERAVEPAVTLERGIVIPDEYIRPELGRWERQSVSLCTGSKHKRLFSEFQEYFEIEADAIGDDDLSQEVKILEKLIRS